MKPQIIVSEEKSKVVISFRSYGVTRFEIVADRNALTITESYHKDGEQKDTHIGIMAIDGHTIQVDSV